MCTYKLLNNLSKEMCGDDVLVLKVNIRLKVIMDQSPLQNQT